MAVALVASIQTFIGLSSDSKPSGTPVGSRFLETNTGAEYVHIGGDTWSQVRDRLAQWDDTDKLATSLYGKASAAGDTALLVDSSGRPIVVGAAASGSAVAGNPVLVGGADGANARTLEIGIAAGVASPKPLRVVDILEGSSGYSHSRAAQANADGNTGQYLPTAGGYDFNGSTWDKRRSNIEGTLLTSAARTATTSTSEQTNYNARGLALKLDVTANPGGAETLRVRVLWSLGSDTQWTRFAATPAASNGTYTYILYPGIAETIAESNVEVQSFPLPRSFIVEVEHSASGSWTYSLSYAFIN